MPAPGDTVPAAQLEAHFTGLITSTDGGDHWTPIGGDTFNNLNIESIVPSLGDANTIFVAAQSPDQSNRSPKAGVWIGTKSGNDFKFTQVFSKEPSDLVGDPGNANRLDALRARRGDIQHDDTVGQEQLAAD